MSQQANDPFMKALATRLREQGDAAVTVDGNINWSVFARRLPTIHYETLRKIRAGERQLDRRAIEEVASAIGVEPSYFAEYRLMEAQAMFDPREVGFDEAIRNLQQSLQGKAARRRRA